MDTNFSHNPTFSQNANAPSKTKGFHRSSNPDRMSEMNTTSKKIINGKKVFGLDPSVEEIDSVVFHDLHWWTADRDLIGLSAHLGITIEEKDIIFMEHKVNGKSKGQAVINCHSKPNAWKLHEWLHHNTFQGKKITSTLAASILGSPFHPNNQDFPAPRPLSSAIHNTMGQPTNSHGGVNFNRVNKSLRVTNQSGLGNGRPPQPRQNTQVQIQQSSQQAQPHLQNQHPFNLVGFPQPGQNMMMGMYPMDPTFAWLPATDFSMSDYSGSFKQGL
ncbi:hypothetical protein L204_101550 [Cryptococcus depauperatus]